VSCWRTLSLVGSAHSRYALEFSDPSDLYLMYHQTILSPAADIPTKVLSNFRVRIEGVFQRALVSMDKKQLNAVQLDDSLLECFISLSPKCRSEELEDLVYFVLDLYQFSGVSIAIAEVDVDQVTIDLRMALEELAAISQGSIEPIPDNHTFLILDKNIQGLPWESIPVLRGESVSRIPDMRFLLDRLNLADCQRNGKSQGPSVGRARVDPRKTFYLLNPGGDLKGTEGRFNDWLKEMKGVGWKGLTSQVPSEQQFLDALQTQDLVL
jgi:separase